MQTSSTTHTDPGKDDQMVFLRVDLGKQVIELHRDQAVLHNYPVSTALNGAGELSGSGCTPRGKHRVKIKVGAGEPENAVFVGRRTTGEIYSDELAAQYPERDWILTRIIWLTGSESGRNLGGNVDTLRRYIYIHGCPDTEPMGIPRSHGCIRMRNRDIMALFDMVENGMPVEILE
ncbi:L,D-transpeptidase [Solemya velesiana gill symbiont]|uniref:L,D-transpeptidase n=2 Tax=Solemya velesiana gill symbiont TaxID=1918948 RepID=A0A1T2KXD6_9GAMM|nr:L,D-transpeptidase [Solemya velesiana gill symbiont]